MNGVRKHKWALLVALVVAVVSIAPQSVFINSTPDYNGIAMVGTDAEHFYLSRVQEVYTGNTTVGNAYLADKDKPYLYPIFGENIMARLAGTFGVSVMEMNLLLKFILPFLFFLLVYRFVLDITGDTWAALLVPIGIAFGYNLLDGPSAIMSLLTLTGDSSIFLPYTRPIHPSISSFFLIAALWLIYNLWFSKREKRPTLLVLLSLGAFIGLSLHTYIYVWTFLMVVLGLMWMREIANNRYANALDLFVVFVANLAVTIPYWLNFFTARSHPDYLETSARIGLIHTREFIFSTWLALLIVLILALWPKELKNAKPFILIATIATWVVTNQHVITGIRLHYSHYHFYITKPLAVLVLTAIVLSLLRRFTSIKIARVFAIIGLLVLLTNGIITQVAAYKKYAPQFASEQSRAALHEYLTIEYPEAQTIWTDPLTSEFLAVYTNHNTPNHNSLAYFLLPNKILENRLYLNQSIGGLKAENALAQFTQERGIVSKRTYVMRYRESLGSYDAIPNEQILTLAGGFETFVKRDLQEHFTDFGIDLVIWDSREATNPYQNLDFLTQVAEKENFIIYQTSKN